MSAFLVQLGITAGVMIGKYIYHRLNPEPPPEPQAFTRTKVEEGRPITLAFGRCMVRQPVQAWLGEQRARINPETEPENGTFWQNAPYLYDYEVLFNMCIPFQDGVQHIHSIYVGDVRIPDEPAAHPEVLGTPYALLSELTGDGNFEGDIGTRPCFPWAHYSDAASKGSAYEIGGLVEFYNGNALQEFIVGVSANNAAADRMMAMGVLATAIPGYRGMMSIFLGSRTTGRWGIGNTPHAQQLSFEVSTLPGINYFSEGFGIGIGTIGEEANPSYVIASVICDSFGKLGLPKTRLDWPSFQHAAEVLSSEGHGYSRAFEDRVEAREIIDDVLRQTDGLLYEEPTTGLIVYKLIRADYDPNSLLEINPSTCDEVTNFAAGGWTNTTNKIRVRYEDRADEYQDNSATAQNMANAVGQDGETREQVLEYRGIKTSALADAVAARELAFRSRPLARCRAKVDRRFWNARPGDVYRMTWPKLNVSNRVFRCGHVSRGTASENCVYLDLVEDYFYVHRSTVTGTPPVAPFPSEVLG